jgi:hypothetical protein
MSISFIQHKGRKILYIDYSECKSIKETLEVLEQVRNEYLRTNESYYTLNNFTNAPSNNEFMEAAKKYGKELFDARTIKNTGIGIIGIKRILLSAYNLTIKNKLIPFETKEEALDFLAK